MEKKYLVLSLCLSLLLLFSLPLRAQNVVNGTVVGEDNEAIIGASVVVEGTTTGTITDLNGRFSVSVPAKGKLIVSFIGYITQTVTDLKNPRIVLKEDLMKLDEVVVVGYGSQKMKNITGSVATVAPQEITDLSGGNLARSLGGLVNGLSVAGGSARPGEGASLSIRQTKSITGYSPNGGSADPVFVIDDYITTAEAFNNLDASMIESITVLKDAAAAVYGARSSVGAVLVKTKRGQVGTPKISYSGQFGYTDEVARTKMLSAYDYGKLWNGVRGANTSDNSSTDLTRELFQADELAAMKNLNYDLLDREWSAGLTQKHSVNMSGGTDRATFFAGLSYFTQDGNLGRLDYNRWNYRAGVDAKISKWVKSSLQISGDYGSKNTAMNKVGGSSGETDYNALLTNPRYMPDYVNGLPMAKLGVTNLEVDDIQYYNFGAIQNLDNYSKTMSQNMTLNGSLEYDFGWSKYLSGLKLKASYSKSISTNKNNQLGTNLVVYKMINRWGSGSHLYTGDGIDLSASNFEPITISNGNSIRRMMDRSDRYQLNFTAIYERTFGLHTFNGLFTVERAESEFEDLEGIVLDPLSFTDGQSKSANGTQTTSFGRTESGMLSYVGRVNYSYADKYLFEFLVRSDASTKFAPENYWGTFPSWSGGWVMSEESWFKDHVKGIDFFKLRGSFGIMGKDNIAPWAWIQLYNRDANRGPVFGTSANTNVGAGISSSEAPNRDAHWDMSYKFNFGIDARLLDDRFSVNLDAYYDQNRGIFMQRNGAANFPSTVGTRPSAENFGSIDAYGVELSLGWKDKIGKDFKYFVKMNTGYSDNKMLEKAWPDRIAIYEQHRNQRTDLGQWGLECIGMFRSYNDIEEYFSKYKITNYLGLSKDKVYPGMLIYNDVRGPQNADGSYQAPDGVIDLENDLVKISNRDNIYGFTVNLGGEWKGLSFSTQFNANWGGYSFVPKTARSAQNLISSGGDYKDLQYTNLPSFWADDMFVYQDVLDGQGNVVASQNRDAYYPNLRYKTNSETSTFWKVSGTRISLRSLTLAYALPKAWVKKAGIENCRFNLTGQNLLSLYNPYPDNFMDPLSGTYGNYPSLRTFTLGVNLSF